MGPRLLTLMFAFIFLALPLTSHSIEVLSKADIRRIIGPFPKPGSELEKQDDEVLLQYQAQRTDEECKEAASQDVFDYRKIFGKPYGPLTEREISQVQKDLLWAMGEGALTIYVAKNLYKRPRPYDRNPEIVPCIPLEASFAYPSGHATTARLLGKILSRKFPAKKYAIMETADEAGLHRVLGGVHHPSDVEAGYKIGDELAKRMIRELY
jgi:acid phosphatase (class A)